MENKRKSTRGSVSLKVSFRKVKSYLSSGSRIKNISETGMCMPLNLYFPVDSLLELGICLDDFKGPIKILARVVRISDRNNSRYRYDVGLEFLNFPSDKRNMIRDYIHHSLPQEENQLTHCIT